MARVGTAKRAVIVCLAMPVLAMSALSCGKQTTATPDGPGASAGGLGGAGGASGAGGSAGGSSGGGGGDGGGDGGGGAASNEQEECGFLPVVPGARGFGVEGPIARGQPVFRVTNTSLDGPGSLADATQAAEDAGGGVIVFETSGVIDVESTVNSRLNIRASNLWIAGQTAPAPGIFIRGMVQLSGADLLVQHIGVYRPLQSSRQSDSINLSGTNVGSEPGRAILDHVAAWGANDGNLDIVFYGGGEVTVQNSILAAPLTTGHDQNENHNFNSLIYGSPSAIAKITFRYNLFTTARDRQPLSSFDELVIVNNAYYHRVPGAGRFIYLRNFYQESEESKNSIVGNAFWDTSNDVGPNPVLLNSQFSTTSRIHLADNRWNLESPQVPQDQWDALITDNGHPRSPIDAAAPPVWNTCLEAIPSADVIEHVRDHVGPRPGQRIPFLAQFTHELGAQPTHRFPASLEEIDGELLGLAENTQPFETPPSPHQVEANGYTRLENHLLAIAHAVEAP